MEISIFTDSRPSRQFVAKELELDTAEHFTFAADAFIRFGHCEFVHSEFIFVNIAQLLCEVTVFVFKPYNFGLCPGDFFMIG